MAPLLPKLRGQFAEFLNYSSPERLSILYLTTSVGLGYGPNVHSLEAFLGSMSTPPSTQKKCLRFTAQGHPPAGFTSPKPLTAYTAQSNNTAWLPSCVTPSLGYYGSGPTRPIPRHNTRRRSGQKGTDRMVSIPGSPLGAHTRVREYQPVYHRLRLSASP